MVTLGQFSKIAIFLCLLLKDNCSETIALRQYGEINNRKDNKVYSNQWRKKKYKKLRNIFAYFYIDRITE